MKRFKIFFAVTLVLLLLAPHGLAGDKKVNINTATVEQLATLPGIGEATAKNITEHREKNGAFKAVEELKNVKGIGDKKFEQIKGLVTL